MSLILTSHFEFLVGPERTSVTVHKGLASGLSEPLDALMNNGKMLESTTGTAVLEHVEVDVFVAFCEFAYRGSYTVPTGREMDSDSKIPENRSSDPDAGLGGTANVAYPGKTPSYPRVPDEDEWLSTHGSEYDWTWASRCNQCAEVRERRKLSEWMDGPPYMRKARLPPPEPNLWVRLVTTFDELKFAEADLSRERSQPSSLTFHAKVYAFATTYLIRPLRDLCLGYLHHELCEVPLLVENLQYIFDLVEYTYGHTQRGEAWGPKLRELVAHYVASRAHFLSRYDRLWDLLDSYGEAGSDLLRFLVDDTCSK
ncbi:hypothetical protein T310_1715 [Rasamsonia emersonii CBS 393.64]|uniref:BTB domain-containing protein n=1 Tax=Rasamsonia emersonii (strain ATCC 16479 / CBS 393.64 / IMI 116815) TaxID=1408163 RepID=A0A0F4Z2E6_RASE3|nr:hypothetical protein T310_1715 [Rasamsonia emersonii CBS 393.64]KKA24251.1 hypothetical protein T310_1715 [Rasamsonia emersonii CBS 393.64]